MEESVYLTKEQVIKAFEKIEPLISGSAEDENLSLRVAHLEDQLQEEQILRKKLEDEVAANNESEKNWKAMWSHLQEDYEDLREQFEQMQGEYSQDIMDLKLSLDETERELSYLRGEQLSQLSLEELTQLESTLMNSLTSVQTLKSEASDTFVKNEVSLSYSCVLCKKQSIDLLIRPCQHVCICELCLENIERCPICCCFIDSVLKIYVTKY